MIKTNQPHLNISAASHPGMTRKQNEDHYGVRSFVGGPKRRTPSVLAVLCDGIGGHRAGEVAAQMGVSLIMDRIGEGNATDPIGELEKAIKLASDAIYNASLTDQGRSGMGATCAVAWVIGKRLYTANLGDSRLYLLREGHLVQLSTDHTWVQEAIDAGVITDRDSFEHPNAHVIRRYLGSKTTPDPDFRLWFFEGEHGSEALANQGLMLKPGDVVMLCSDGLTDLVSDDEIRDVILKESLETAPDLLIEMANQRGGHDNTTIVLMGVPGRGEAMGKPRRWKRLRNGCLAALAVVAFLATAILFGMRWWRGMETDPATLTPTPAFTQTLEMPPAHYTLVPSPMVTIEATMIVPEGSPTLSASRTPWPTNTPGQ